MPAVSLARWQDAQESERRFWAKYGLGKFCESTAGAMQTAMWARRHLGAPVGDWLDVGIGPLGVGCTHFLGPTGLLHTIDPIELVPAENWPIPEPCKALVRASQQLSKTHLGQAEQLDFADDSFSLVAMENMLDHVQDPDRALGEARRVLKPEGRLLLTVHTYSVLGELRYHAKKPVKARQGKTQRTFWRAHPHRFSSASIQRLVRSAGFEIVHIDTASRIHQLVGRGRLTRLIAI